MPSMVTPSSSTAPRIRGASSPGSTISARSEPSRRNRKQFSAIWPTVNMRTSIGSALGLAGAAALRLALGPLLGLLAEMALIEEAVHQEGHRHVEAHHQRADQPRRQRALPEPGQERNEQPRGDPALLERRTPVRRLRSAVARLLLGAASGPRLRLAPAPRTASRRAPVDSTALGAALLAAALALGLGHRRGG